MKKLGSLKEGERFMWDGKKWFLDRLFPGAIPNCVCKSYPDKNSLVYLPKEMIIKPIIRVNLN